MGALELREGGSLEGSIRAVGGSVGAEGGLGGRLGGNIRAEGGRGTRRGLTCTGWGR